MKTSGVNKKTIGGNTTFLQKAYVCAKFVNGITPPYTTNYALRSVGNSNLVKRYKNYVKMVQ